MIATVAALVQVADISNLAFSIDLEDFDISTPDAGQTIRPADAFDAGTSSPG